MGRTWQWEEGAEGLGGTSGARWEGISCCMGAVHSHADGGAAFADVRGVCKERRLDWGGFRCCCVERLLVALLLWGPGGVGAVLIWGAGPRVWRRSGACAFACF